MSALKISVNEEAPVALISGGAGFIGASLCRHLLKKNVRVICLDNFHLGRWENINDLLTDKNFHLLEKDFRAPLFLTEKIDYIFHLADLEKYLSGKRPTLEVSQEGLVGTQNLLELARQNRSKFLLAAPDKSLSFFLNEIKKIQGRGDYRLVGLSDVYGPGMDLDSENVTARLIKAACCQERILVANREESIFPLFVEEAVEGIIKATLLSNTAGKAYQLFGSKIALGELAQTLGQITGKKVESDWQKGIRENSQTLSAIDFKEGVEPLDFQPKVSLEEGLQKTLALFLNQGSRPEEGRREREEVPTEEKKVVEEIRVPLWHFLVKLVFSLLLLFLAATFPFLSLSWDIFWGQKNLRFLQKNAFSLSSSVVQVKAEEAKGHFLRGREKLVELGWLFKLVGQTERQREWEERFKIGEIVASGAEDVGNAGGVLENVRESILREGKIQPEEIEQGKTYLAGAFEKWGEAEAKMRQNPKLEDKAWLEQLVNFRRLLKEGEKWLGLLPRIIGLGEKRTYLLLLQNNMEARPTGGFIGSLGFLTFENGKLVDLKVEDVYAVDGQLRGHVEPPEPIKKYLGKEHWFLRDSNWSPDFPQSAQKAQWFLEKESGIKVDGVWALDLNFAQDLLGVLGKVELTDYQESVDQQNLFEKTQKYVEEDFFPGSTQKKDFLGSLTRQLVEKIKEERGKQLALAKAVNQSLTGRHMLLYFNDSQLEEEIIQNGWGGEVRGIPCESDPGCLGDFLLTVEANLGINKVNYWVKKEMRDEINFSEGGQVSHRLTLTYQNTSLPNTLNGGVYKNYLRIYAPPNSTLEEIKIDGQEVNLDSAASSAGLKGNLKKNIFGFYFEVPPESQKRVSISYHLAPTFSGSGGNYQLLFQKQAGAQTAPLTVEISYPSSWQIKEANFSGLTEPGRLTYNGNLWADEELKISF